MKLLSPLKTENYVKASLCVFYSVCDDQLVYNRLEKKKCFILNANMIHCILFIYFGDSQKLCRNLVGKKRKKKTKPKQQKQPCLCVLLSKQMLACVSMVKKNNQQLLHSAALCQQLKCILRHSESCLSFYRQLKIFCIQQIRISKHPRWALFLKNYTSQYNLKFLFYGYI